MLVSLQITEPFIKIAQKKNSMAYAYSKDKKVSVLENENQKQDVSIFSQLTLSQSFESNLPPHFTTSAFILLICYYPWTHNYLYNY